jgi:hypothetical protein
MKLGIIYQTFLDTFPSCFNDRNVEVFGKLEKANGSLLYLIKKHKDSEGFAATAYYLQVESQKFKYTSYDGKTLREHQENNNNDNYLWASHLHLKLHEHSNKAVKHLLQKLEEN